MKTVTALLTELVSSAFASCGYDRALGVVTASDRMDLCQFQCNGAFAAAKAHRKAPLAVASEVAGVLSGQALFSKVEAVKPGFLNLTLTDQAILDLARQIAADPHLGVPQAERPQTIVLDYGGPNVAKPLHIGHLRSAIIGESLKRLIRACGHKAIGDVHLGDWGLQIGLVIAELKERNPQWPIFAPDFDPASGAAPELTADGLNDIYPFASKKSKENEDFKRLAQQITYELQAGHPGYLALWREIMRVSITDLKRNYALLSVDFDCWYGESDSEQYIGPLMDILKSRGLLVSSEGAQVVEVAEADDKAPMPPIIIKKSDNSNIYATTDLATILQRQHDFAPDRIWYVVDKRQGLHFTQVFRCAKKAGLVPEGVELEHLGFGTMNGPDGKPYKTRDGGVMRLSDLIDSATQAAAEKMRAAGQADGEDLETARKIGIAAVKFGDLINHRTKDYIFDLDKFLSFEGKTGTYLLYTVTRIQSILNKAGVRPGDPMALNGVYSADERELLLRVLLTGDVFEHALAEKAPNYISENAYQIASSFSRFYHDNHVLDEADADKRQSWLAFLLLIRSVLLKHLDILGIEPVEHM